MIARVELIDADGWNVLALVPCKSGFHALDRIAKRYPNSTIKDVRITEAAHA